MCTQEPWALWETPCEHRVELGVQWSRSATDLPRAFERGTTVTGLHAFRLVIRTWRAQTESPSEHYVLLRGFCSFFSPLVRQGVEGSEDAVDKSDVS